MVINKTIERIKVGQIQVPNKFLNQKIRSRNSQGSNGKGK